MDEDAQQAGFLSSSAHWHRTQHRAWAGFHPKDGAASEAMHTWLCTGSTNLGVCPRSCPWDGDVEVVTSSLPSAAHSIFTSWQGVQGGLVRLQLITGL